MDLTCGPDDRDQVVALPIHSQFRGNELRGTIAAITARSLDELRSVMNDSTNWVGILPQFRHERALSDYIAAYPHRLEEGLVRHLGKKVRERVFRQIARGWIS